MIDYLVNGHKYGLSYADLREKYREFRAMSDQDFLVSLPRLAHFVCIVGWMKELPADATIGDRGIVHELIHLMAAGGTTTSLADVRAQFNALLELA